MSLDGSSSAHGAPRTGSRTHLPLVPCPECGEEIVELECGPGSKVPGAIFFKCRLHDRDDSSSCPWYRFEDKYRRLLISKGIIQNIEVDSSSYRPAGSSPEVEHVRVAIGRIEGLLEENRVELAPLLEDLASVNNVAVTVNEKLETLIVIGKVAALCLVLVVVCVVVGLIILLVK